MGAPRKYPNGIQERATTTAVKARLDPDTGPGALARIGKQLGINPETLRNRVDQAEMDGGQRPGTSTDEAARIAALERGEPGASPRQGDPDDGVGVFHSGGARPPTEAVAQYFDEHRERFGFETPDPRKGESQAAAAGSSVGSRQREMPWLRRR